MISGNLPSGFVALVPLWSPQPALQYSSLPRAVHLPARGFYVFQYYFASWASQSGGNAR